MRETSSGDEGMGKEEKGELPSCLNTAFALNPYFRARFETLTEEERRVVTERLQEASSEEEKRCMLDSFVGTKEAKGPVQL